MNHDYGLNTGEPTFDESVISQNSKSIRTDETSAQAHEIPDPEPVPGKDVPDGGDGDDLYDELAEDFLPDIDDAFSASSSAQQSDYVSPIDELLNDIDYSSCNSQFEKDIDDDRLRQEEGHSDLDVFWKRMGIMNREAYGFAVNMKPVFIVCDATSSIFVVNSAKVLLDFLDHDYYLRSFGDDEEFLRRLLGELTEDEIQELITVLKKDSKLFYDQNKVSFFSYIDACVSAIRAEVSTNWVDVGARNASRYAVTMFLSEVMAGFTDIIKQHLRLL